jgi:hypothetical protein
VGHFLHELRETDLLKKYMQTGRRKFPRVAFFHWMCGEIEVDRGPRRCNRAFALKCFQRVIELAADSSDPADALLVESAKKRLTKLSQAMPSALYHDDDDDDDDDEYDGNGGGPFGFQGGPIDAAPRELFNMFREMCDALGLDPDDVLRDPETANRFGRQFGRWKRRKTKT